MKRKIASYTATVLLTAAVCLGVVQATAPETPPVHSHKVLTFGCKDCINALAQFIAAVNSETQSAD